MKAVFENKFCNLQIYLSFFMLSNRIQNDQELSRRVASVHRESLICGCNLVCVNKSIIWFSSDKHSTNSYSSLSWHKAVSDPLAKYCRKRLKRRNDPPGARETGKESSLGQRVKTMLTGYWRLPNRRARVGGNRCNSSCGPYKIGTRTFRKSRILMHPYIWSRAMIWYIFLTW